MSEMTLKQTINDAMKAAMRAKEKARLGTIRLIQADIKRIEVDERVELDDARVIVILDKMLKQRKDSITQYESANRADLADVEKAEMLVIKDFLPEALTEQELTQLIDKAIEQTGAQSMRDMGKVVGLLKPQVQGRGDMAAVSKAVKARLS